MKINEKVCFFACLEYIKDDYLLAPDVWEVSYFLESMHLFSFDEHIVTHTDDPAYWYDWKDLIEEKVKSNPMILDEENGLNLLQGLVAIDYFMDKRYRKKMITCC